ncbi:MAG: GNAT family N-acetyltransferase [Thermoprotei archaeon]|nr:GNAT family N-acetyltransferase [Thermoprotei archaeon]
MVFALGEGLEVKYTSQVFYVKFNDGSKAFLKYSVEGGKMTLIETYTPEQHRGKGVARLMIEKALEVASRGGLKIVPLCSYSVYYFLKNPSMRSMLAEPYNSMGDEELKRYYEERLQAEKAKKSE